MKFILGQKLGMSQVFDEKGKRIPVTLIEAGPCLVTQVKTKEKDGYQAIQLGFKKIKKEEKIKKSRVKTGRDAGPAPRQKEISDAGVKKTEKASPEPVERVESAPKMERPKLKPEREERKPIIERGMRRIFKRKAF